MKPLCAVCGRETKRNDSVTCSKDCHAKRLSARYSGRTLSEEWKRNQSAGKRRENIVKHGEFHCEKCGKFFSTNLSLRAHKSYCTPAKEELGFSCATCHKVFSSSRGLKIHSHCHDEEWNGARRLKLKAKAQSRQSQSTSLAELSFYQKLIDSFGHGNVIHKFKIDGCPHEYDFFIPVKNLIIEFDGDYWHGNRLIYELTPRMKRQFHLDRRWDEIAIRAGYHIKRIWQSEHKQIQLEKL